MTTHLHTPDGEFKLVDTFNGWESEERYASEGDAEEALQHQKREFYDQPGNRSYKWCRVVASANVSWDWDYRQNKFRWS
jgi:hypothetical protein